MSNKKSSGRVWPYAIGGAITLVFGFCVTTVIVTSKADLQLSDAYMTYYQDADANANKIIQARIAFDKKYKIEYVNNGIKQGKSEISYKVTDLNDHLVNDAKMILATSRSETSKLSKKYEIFKVENGIYTFSDLDFPKAGIWNLIAKVTIGDDYRFYNIKADTREKKVTEF